jgi:hypothetical protein
LVRGIFGSLPHVGNRRLHALLYIAPQHPQRLFNASAAFRDRFLGPSEVHQTDVAQSRRQYQVWQFVQHPAEEFVRNTRRKLLCLVQINLAAFSEKMNCAPFSE